MKKRSEAFTDATDEYERVSAASITTHCHVHAYTPRKCIHTSMVIIRLHIHREKRIWVRGFLSLFLCSFVLCDMVNAVNLAKTTTQYIFTIQT